MAYIANRLKKMPYPAEKTQIMGEDVGVRSRIVAGEYGTLSEIALARKLGKRGIGLGTWDLGAEHVTPAATPGKAVRLALKVARP